MAPVPTDHGVCNTHQVAPKSQVTNGAGAKGRVLLLQISICRYVSSGHCGGRNVGSMPRRWKCHVMCKREDECKWRLTVNRNQHLFRNSYHKYTLAFIMKHIYILMTHKYPFIMQPPPERWRHCPRASHRRTRRPARGIMGIVVGNMT